MTLWDAVYRTDPAHTKSFTKGGGFSGTAIKPFYLIKKATDVFGACGIGWGWKEIENKYVAGVWCSKVELWYVHEGKRGVVEQWGQTVMEGKNKNGVFVDEEAPKKAITDAVTKCLSYLGFAGDVHMGRFDDSKYIDQRLKEEKAESSASHQRRMAKFLSDVETFVPVSIYLQQNSATMAEYLDFPEKEMVQTNLGEKIYNGLGVLIDSSDDPAELWGQEKYAIDWLKLNSKKHYDDLVVAARKRKEELELKSGFETK